MGQDMEGLQWLFQSRVSCGAASLPHNHLWVLTSPLASASVFSGKIEASPGVLGCTQPSLISGPHPAVGMCVIGGEEGQGLSCPWGGRRGFPDCMVGS